VSAAFAVRYTSTARDDLLRLFEFLLDRAKTVEDFDDAQRAIDAITAEVESRLTRTPFIYRKVGANPFVREMIIPHQASGYVVLYEIEGGSLVNIVAVRHQLEDDYY
jgi:plasmid stabilization system protein ParE